MIPAIYRDPWASLGFRRLAIIDVAGGHQPMANEDALQLHHLQRRNLQSRQPAPRARTGRPPLHQPLRHRNHPPRLRSSTAPIAFCSFRGMFAFAIWDKHRPQTLLRPRPPRQKALLLLLGRPHSSPSRSEIKALLRAPRHLARNSTRSLLPEYLAFGYVSDERTLFRGIRKLMPGHHLTLDLAAPSPAAPTSASIGTFPTRSPKPRSDASWIAECRDRLEADRPHAPDERRPARHVSLRRRRFQRHRRAHEAQLRRAR